jgi:hypothetical protein
MTQNLKFITLIVLTGLAVAIGGSAATQAQQNVEQMVKHQEQAVALPVQVTL